MKFFNSDIRSFLGGKDFRGLTTVFPHGDICRKHAIPFSKKVEVSTYDAISQKDEYSKKTLNLNILENTRGRHGKMKVNSAYLTCSLPLLLGKTK